MSQNLLAGANTVPSCDVELCPRPPSRVPARFYGETGHFKLNFCIENSNFSQFFVSGIHIYTFSHNFAGKKFRFIGTLSLKFLLHMTTSFIKENHFNNCI